MIFYFLTWVVVRSAFSVIIQLYSLYSSILFMVMLFFHKNKEKLGHLAGSV